ncbi:MAG TPA: OmpA family protein [Burkholderiaceae bacterium]|nr:OmpA family protein [Burkholderiaceae bacterium]
MLGCSTPAAPPKEAKIATLKQLGFTPASDGWEISLGVKLLFDSDVDSLSDQGRTAVSDLARTLREVGIDRIRVDGHTDNVGSDKYNAGLSRRRAESVAQHLVKVGWRDETIERHGFGADKPVADNATPAGRAQNRRVVIAVQVE